MTNVLLNPGFEDGTGSWTYLYDGSSTFTADTVSPYSGLKCAKLAVSTKGTYNQFMQINFPFVASTPYRLSFAAYSVAGTNVDVAIIKHASPYTNYGFNVTNLNLSNAWQLFTYDFTTTVSATSDARLFFQLQTYISNGSVYYIDQVNLQKVSEIQPKMFALFE